MHPEKSMAFVEYVGLALEAGGRKKLGAEGRLLPPESRTLLSGWLRCMYSTTFATLRRPETHCGAPWWRGRKSKSSTPRSASPTRTATWWVASPIRWRLRFSARCKLLCLCAAGVAGDFVHPPHQRLFGLHQRQRPKQPRRVQASLFLLRRYQESLCQPQARNVGGTFLFSETRVASAFAGPSSFRFAGAGRVVGWLSSEKSSLNITTRATPRRRLTR